MLYLQSPKGGCCSISDDLSSSFTSHAMIFQLYM